MEKSRVAIDIDQNIKSVEHSGLASIGLVIRTMNYNSSGVCWVFSLASNTRGIYALAVL